MTHQIRRSFLAFLAALLATAGLLAVTTSSASALAPLTAFSIMSSDSSSVAGQAVTLSVNLTGGSGAPTGTVDIIDGVTTICPSLPLTNDGTVAFGFCTLSNLAVGSHSITASYSGDGTYDPDVTTGYGPAFSQTVAKASTSTTITSDVAGPDYGDAVTFTATILATAPGAGTRTGTVAFSANSVSITGCTASSITAGEATCATSALPAGSNAIGAVYSGDGNFLTSSAPTFAQTVDPAATTTSLVSAPNPSAFNGAIDLTATVASGAGTPGGTVAFKTGSITITGCGAVVLALGEAICSTSELAVGANAITAVYAASTNFLTSTSSTLTQTVAVATTITALTSDQEPSRSGQSVTFTAAVSSTAGVPTGTVRFYAVQRDSTRVLIATETLTAGSATASIADLPVRMDSPIVADYSGDGNFGLSSGTVDQTVFRSFSRTLMSSSANPSTFGQVVTMTVRVRAMGAGAGIPRGKVAFYRVTDGIRKWIGTAVLVNGIAVIRTSKTPVGVSDMIAQYNGNANFRPSSRTGVQRVHAA